MGSNPQNKNYPDNLTGDERTAQMYVNADIGNYSGNYFTLDTNYETDYNRLNKAGMLAVGDKSTQKYYWLASRNVYLNSNSNYEHYSFGMRVLNYLGETPTQASDRGVAWIYVEEYNSAGGPGKIEYGLRPVFKLLPSVKIIDGEGTEEVPYEIGI